MPVQKKVTQERPTVAMSIFRINEVRQLQLPSQHLSLDVRSKVRRGRLQGVDVPAAGRGSEMQDVN